MPVVFINFFGIFPTQLPKRMEREDANLPSLQLWRKSCNKRALEASSWTIEWQMSWGKRLEPCVQSFSEQRGKVEVSVPRGSLTNDAPKFALLGYFITSWIITLLKASVRGFQRFQRGEFSLALRLCLWLSQRQDESFWFCPCLLSE